jgi:hypothetical protein
VEIPQSKFFTGGTMALVKCKDCDELYSDRFSKCPKCSSEYVTIPDARPRKKVELPAARYEAAEEGFLKSLFDFKFETYITKRVASVVYAVLSVVIAIATVLATLYTGWLFIESWEWMQYGGFTWIPLLSFVATPFVGLLTIIAIRLTFETSIALVDIAQNTKR